MSRIRNIRKKILSPNYYKSRLQQFMEQEKHWTDFLHFKCEEFFVGRETAMINKMLYNKEISRVRAKIKWYRNKVWNTESEQ